MKKLSIRDIAEMYKVSTGHVDVVCLPLIAKSKSPNDYVVKQYSEDDVLSCFADYMEKKSKEYMTIANEYHEKAIAYRNKLNAMRNGEGDV